jgi:AI-2 transport protein TqsA
MALKVPRNPTSIDPSVLVAVLLSGAAIYLLQGVIAPLALAVFLLVVIGELSSLVHRLAPKAPRILALGLSLTVIVVAFAMISWIIIDNLTRLLADTDKYVERLDSVLLTIGNRLGLELPPNIERLLENIEPSRVAGGVLAWIRGGVTLVVFVLVYLAFLMASRRSFALKLTALTSVGEGAAEAKAIFERIRQAVGGYVWIQTITGLMIAGASWLVMQAVGLPHPIFWAFVILVSSYLPIVGGVFGVLGPTLFGLLEFDDLTRPIVLLVGLQAIQLIVGYIVQPRMQGGRLNIDPVIVLLSLALWSVLLGTTGAFLSTPLTVAAMAILAEFRTTRWMAVLLSSDGNPYPTKPVRRAGEASAAHARTKPNGRPGDTAAKP